MKSWWIRKPGISYRAVMSICNVFILVVSKYGCRSTLLLNNFFITAEIPMQETGAAPMIKHIPNVMLNAILRISIAIVI